MWPFVRPEVKKTFVESPAILEDLAKKNVNSKCFVHEIPYTSKTLPKRIYLGNAADTNAYHVFAYMLSRFYFFDNGKDDIIFFYDSPERPYVLEAAFKNLPKRFIRETVKTPGYEYVEMPGCWWYSSCIDEPWIYDYLRDLFKPLWESVKQEKGKYTYISRNKRDIPNRRCLNEDELIRPLKELGFSSYNLNTLTFEQQIRLFRSSEVITGVHGAGLTWLLFCEPGTSIVEIHHPSWDIERGHYGDIAKKSGLHYFRFLGAREPLPDECEGPYNGTDVIVDKDVYLRALKHVVSLRAP